MSPTEQEVTRFPVVGIGASAGGLEAMSVLLKHLPSDIGMAFVLVQHLAPEHESMMTELLARATSLSVSEVKDGMKIMPNHVYVIPPNAELGIINKVLHLMPRTQKQHLPIDYFFQSLAKDQGSNAIGIILSGSASDGTLGLKAIKAENGITFAQTEESARYDSMPASAIASGCVDFVLAPEGIALELAHLAQYPNMLRADVAANKGDNNSHIDTELEKVFLLLRNRTGNDFSHYKQTTLHRRISRRMLVNKIDRLKDYVRYLNSHPAEVDALFQDILINVTSFFRDPDVFEALKKTVYPVILQERNHNRPIRIWVPGCSSGEEVYSIIISLLEYLGDDVAGTTIQVFASDIDPEAISKARTGIYPEGIDANVSKERLRRFFNKVPRGYQINKRIRDLCVFATQNITKDPPFSHLDLTACRNMLIYMNNILQRKVLQTLHYALNPGGYLLLGSSETIGASADMFAVADAAQKIYKKKDVSQSARYRVNNAEISFPLYSAPPEKTLVPGARPLDLQRFAESIILNQYSPPGVVVSERLDVIQFIGNMGPYMAPAPGTASLNLIKLAHPDLIAELRIVTHHAIEERAVTRRENIRLRHNGKIEDVTIEVVPIQVSSAAERYYLVIFLKGAEYDARQLTVRKPKSGKLAKETDLIIKLEQELEATKAYMHAIIEDHATSNEELQAANEEIQSTNEELQSTNEELETAKEELQSTNEELVTVNEELENRNRELYTSNDDLKNIIASTELPVVMLNERLNVRFFSPQAHQLLNLIDSDIGRPIGNIRANLDTGDLTGHVNHVIETLQPMSTEVHNDTGRWYTMLIRPYRTEDNRIKGAVIVFVDITDSKTLQRATRLATVVEDANDAITVLHFDGSIMEWNPKAIEIYGYTEEEAINTNIDVIVPETKQQELKTAINDLKQGKLVRPFETERRNKDGKNLKMLVTMSLLNNEHGKPIAIATTEHLLEN